ncbi:MAG: hypothetical protein ACKV2V_18270 [Blastocatellia bacterium]
MPESRSETAGRHVREILADLCRNPWQTLIRDWNWKTALLSALARGGLFFMTTLPAGAAAATAALGTELSYRAVLTGMLGALLQALRNAQPAWLATLLVMAIIPVLSHVIEWLVHRARGTQNLGSGILLSLCFTALSTAFNLFAMRRNALLTGPGGASMGHDLRRLPGLACAFLFAWLPRSIRRRDGMFRLS